MAPLPRIRVEGTWWRVVRGGGDPFAWTDEPADGRWQRGSVIRALYLADTEATAWAEWYRHTAEVGVPPAARLPRDAWQIAVALDDVADLRAPATLRRQGIRRLQPTRAQWPVTQPVGEARWAEGCRAIVAPSAAHVGGSVLAVFRPAPGPIAGLRALPPPASYEDLPVIPTGLRT